MEQQTLVEWRNDKEEYTELVVQNIRDLCLRILLRSLSIFQKVPNK